MKEISIFRIYKKEIIWSTESDEESSITELGAVRDEETAREITQRLNESNRELGSSYFYKNLNLTLFSGVKDFAANNGIKSIVLE